MADSSSASAGNAGKSERPVRGDNRTGQAIWALGVDGRLRRIQPRWGGITAPTYVGRGRAAARSNDPAIFLTFWQEFFGGDYFAAKRLALPGAGFCHSPARAGGLSAPRLHR